MLLRIREKIREIEIKQRFKSWMGGWGEYNFYPLFGWNIHDKEALPPKTKKYKWMVIFKQESSLRKKSCQFDLETIESMLLKIVFYINKILNPDHVPQKCYEWVKRFT